MSARQSIWPEQGLEVAIYPVRDLLLGDTTASHSGVLTVDAPDLAKHMADAAGLAGVEVQAARPGEPVRIVHILDAIELRCKRADTAADPQAGVLPGFLGPSGPSGPAGTGVTHVLDGMAVLLCGEVPGLVESQFVGEALVDLAAPIAPYSPFARTLNLILTCHFHPAQGPLERVACARRAGLLVARLLAEATLDQEPAAM